MKKSIKYLVVVSFFTFSGFSQKIQLAEADKMYDKYAYVDVIKTYEKIFEKGFKSADMLKKLGNAYYFRADYANATKWYAELFALPQSVEPEYYYKYAQSLKSINDYEKADEFMKLFYKKNKEDLRARLADSQKGYLAVIKKNSGRFSFENAGINSNYSDYGSTFFDNKIIFTSVRDKSYFKSTIDLWSGENFSNLYAADLNSDGSLSNPKRFGGNLNSKFNESTPVFTKDGQTVYFTRNNYLNGKKGKDLQKNTLLKLYKATLSDGKWVDIKELPFNSDDYSVAHPALSKDDNTLFFVSNMPGTVGASDIFQVSIIGEDSYGTPLNLGKKINTEGRETFPFVSSDDKLYFASDGHPGLGGLDVFVVSGVSSGNIGAVQNVGEPINSVDDDFCFEIDTKTSYGFVSSNRQGGNGKDDIYKITELKKLAEPCQQSLSGIVKDLNDNHPIAYAKVTLFDDQFNLLKETKADGFGKYDLGNVECDMKYNLRAEREAYITVEQDIVVSSSSGKTDLPLGLGKNIQQIKVGDNIAKILEIKSIYFDLNKSIIRSDASLELAKILYVLEQYPTMEIDIRSHTDCRQTAKYNLVLSDRRVKSTIAWLVSQGVSKSRLTGRGYGESQLVNDCGCEPTNESSCTEEQHQANRRSDFIITKL